MPTNRNLRVLNLIHLGANITIELNLCSFHRYHTDSFLKSLPFPPTPMLQFSQNGSSLYHILNQFLFFLREGPFVLAHLYFYKCGSTSFVLPPFLRLFINLDAAHCYFFNILIFSSWTSKFSESPTLTPSLTLCQDLYSSKDSLLKTASWSSHCKSTNSRSDHSDAIIQ